MKKGFTLVEVLVAISIFAVLLVMVSSLFLQSLDIQRRAFNIQQAEENASFVLEAMIKEIRVSTLDSSVVDNDCSSAPSVSLKVVHPDHGNVEFRLSGTDILRIVNGVSSTMNSNSVQFVNFGFCVSGAGILDGKQPRITIISGIQSTKTRQQAVINAETTVSLRELSN